MVLNQIRSLYMASPAVSRLIYIIYLSILKNTISSHLMAAHALKVLVTVIVAVVLCAAVLAPTMAEAGCVDHCGCEPCLAPKGSACTDMCRRPPSCETDCRQQEEACFSGCVESAEVCQDRCSVAGDE